jgi:hypothetical protein
MEASRGNNGVNGEEDAVACAVGGMLSSAFAGLANPMVTTMRTPTRKMRRKGEKHFRNVMFINKETSESNL